jgi:uncharacterized membrane protein YfcA
LVAVAPLAPASEYWFMFPSCVMIAGASIFVGISGATLLLPLFFLLFPVFGVPALTPPQAVGAALVLQVFAFGLAVYRYARRGLVQWPLVRTVAALSVPAATAGALFSPLVPVAVFRLIFAAGLVAIVPSLWRPHPRPGVLTGALTLRQVVFAGGLGGVFTGVVSAGVGETTVPILCRRSLAMPAIAATATVLVAVTVGAATVTTAARLIVEGRLTQFAWPVVAWGAPGAIVGEELAVRSQGRISDRPVQMFLGGLFIVISAAFIALALQ